MAKQVIDIGTTPNDGTGDPLRDAFNKTNENFTELYAGAGAIPTQWNFATSGVSAGDYPTDLTKRYFTTDDSVYPFGTEFWTNGSGGWFTK